MQKIRTTVKIAGKDYTISSYDDEAYAQLAVLTAINVTDDMLKAHDEIRRLREEVNTLREENQALKREAGLK